MEGIRATIGGRSLIFGIDGKVAEVSAGVETVVGAWRSDSPGKDNKIRFDISGAQQTPVQAFYSFNGNNQLVASLGSAANPSFTFLGGIEIDDKHDLSYNVIDATSGAVKSTITVYGGLSFAASTVNLKLDLTGGGTAEIKGDRGVQSLEALQNTITTTGFKADDLLRFRARTTNRLTNGTDATKLAKLKFMGNWDVENGSVVFLSKISNTPSKSVSLGFAGKFKAVSAGFVYFADGATSTISLNIRGSHQRKSGGITTQIDWETSIGFTGKTFKAALNVKTATTFPSGQALTVEGDLKLEKGQNSFTFELSLDIVYEFKDGSLTFKADIKNGVRPSYDLRLEGDFKYKNLSINFNVHLSSVAGSREVSVSVGVEGNEASMVKHLALMLNITQSAARARVELNIEIEARLRFVNGKPITTEVTGASGARALAKRAGTR